MTLWLEINVQSNYSKQTKQKEEMNRERKAKRKRPTRKKKLPEYHPHEITLNHSPQAVQVDISPHKEKLEHQR
jgi:hypothetical protein